MSMNESSNGAVGMDTAPSPFVWVNLLLSGMHTSNIYADSHYYVHICSLQGLGHNMRNVRVSQVLPPIK